MRYLENETTYILANFNTGDTVTIDVYRLSDNVKVINAASMTEVSTTGRFKYSFSQSISTKTEYLYICTNSIEEQQGKIILGGYPDAIYDRIGAPDGASIAADLVTIDNFVDELESRLSAARAGYLDNLSAGAVALASVCTNTRLAELDAANLPGSIGDLTVIGTQNLTNTNNLSDRLTATRAAYLDNLSAGAVALASDVAAIPSDVWDEILTGATHNIPTSAGRRVREIGAFAIHSGTAQAGNSHSITLAATADANNGVYNRNLIVLTDNTGTGQTRTIVDYDATTKIVVVDRDWRVSPDATTEYQIVPDDTPLTVDHGVARGGTNRTITIRTYAASDDDAYLCNIVTIIAGAGRGQARLVNSYDGTNKIVTICGDDWVVTPDTTSVYVMMPYGVACAACMGSEALDEIGDCVWDEDLTTHSTAKSAGWIMRKIKAITDAFPGITRMR